MKGILLNQRRGLSSYYAHRRPRFAPRNPPIHIIRTNSSTKSATWKTKKWVTRWPRMEARLDPRRCPNSEGLVQREISHPRPYKTSTAISINIITNFRQKIKEKFDNFLFIGRAEVEDVTSAEWWTPGVTSRRLWTLTACVISFGLHTNPHAFEGTQMHACTCVKINKHHTHTCNEVRMIG